MATHANPVVISGRGCGTFRRGRRGRLRFVKLRPGTSTEEGVGRCTHVAQRLHVEIFRYMETRSGVGGTWARCAGVRWVLAGSHWQAGVC